VPSASKSQGGIVRTRWPDKNGALVKEFLRSFHAPSKRARYASALNDFQNFVKKRSLNQTTLRAWLRACSAKYGTYRLILSGRIADRFLDWLVNRNLVRVNPLAQLRQKYECQSRSKAPLIRALISTNPSQALEALRPAPRYVSHLGPIMRDHVLRMRSLGYRYRHEYRFIHFDRFLQGRLNAAAEPLSKLVHEYAAVATSPAQKLQRFNTGRIVAKALTRSGTPTVPLFADRLLNREVIRKRKRPYIYTEQQIAVLLETARSYPGRRAKLRPLTLYTMFVLAYCAGLRLGEIVRLKLKDVDLSESAIEIRGTKFFKSRRLPISVSAMAALREYLDARRKSGAPPDPESAVFIHQHGGYSIVTAGKLGRHVIRRAGINKDSDRCGPRFHSLRHTFVAHRMMVWYREGINPQSRLPYLATYLGHRDIHSTLVYLTITEDVLQQANPRFRSAESVVLKMIEGGSFNG
jgi:integrase/recombinase XerD